jgi:hypothetical protein
VLVLVLSKHFQPLFFYTTNETKSHVKKYKNLRTRKKFKQTIVQGMISTLRQEELSSLEFWDSNFEQVLK